MTLLENLQGELIAGGITNSISVSTIPQDATLPAVVLHSISENHLHHLTNSAGSAKTRIQISCVAGRYDDARSLNESIRLILDALAPAWCDCLIYDGTNETYAPKSGQDAATHQVSSDYICLHDVAVPVR